MLSLDSLTEEFLDLKRQREELDARLSTVREQILSLLAGPVKVQVGEHVIEVRESTRRVYDPVAFRAAVPQALFDKVIEISPGKVSALLRAGLLSDEQLAGSYAELKVTALVIK